MHRRENLFHFGGEPQPCCFLGKWAKALVLLSLLPLFLGACSPFWAKDRPIEKQVFDVMDTDVSLKAFGPQAEKAIDAAIEEMKRLDLLLSAYHPHSEISLINKRAGDAPVKVSEDTLKVVDRSVYFARLSKGVFDPTILPVMKVWAHAQAKEWAPSQEDVAKALELVDYTHVKIDHDESTVFLSEKGMGLDLGAIAKGYAVDKMAEIFFASKVDSFLINAGGNVYAGRKKPDGTLWKIGITDPRSPEDLLGVMEGEYLSVVSSGDYRRYFEVDGKVYHHIIDPRTGYPSETSRGTTVFLPSSTDADALSTTLFILGPEAGEGILTQFAELGVIFVDQDGAISIKGLVEGFEFK